LKNTNSAGLGRPLRELRGPQQSQQQLHMPLGFCEVGSRIVVSKIDLFNDKKVRIATGTATYLIG